MGYLKNTHLFNLQPAAHFYCLIASSLRARGRNLNFFSSVYIQTPVAGRKHQLQALYASKNDAQNISELSQRHNGNKTYAVDT